MEAISIVASLSVKAIRSYFHAQEVEQLEKLIEQSNQLYLLNVHIYIQDKFNLLRQANQEFRDGLLSNNFSSRQIALRNAYEHYTALSVLPVNEFLPDNTRIANEDFITWGFWGRFLYFGVMNDFRNAAIQSYECALLLPHKAITLFDSSFFPTIDCSQLSELCENKQRIRQGGPLLGIYAGLPINMAKPLIDMQINKYMSVFKQILGAIADEKY